MIAEHRWNIVSRHRSSEGTVIYESCHCGMLRVRQVDPEALSGGGRPPAATVATARPRPPARMGG